MVEGRKGVVQANALKWSADQETRIVTTSVKVSKPDGTGKGILHAQATAYGGTVIS